MSWIKVAALIALLITILLLLVPGIPGWALTVAVMVIAIGLLIP